MKSILKDTNNSEKLLNMVSDTLILMDKDGICVDMAVHNVDLWFMNEERLLGKNLLNLLPPVTYSEFYPEFKKVLLRRTKSVRNYELMLRDDTYFFKCIMQPYGDLVLCQYRDITERSQRKLELERRNRELYEIQKAAFIGRWVFDTATREFGYAGHTGIMCKTDEQAIPLDAYLNLILPEDRNTFENWLGDNLKGNMENTVDYRILYNKDVHYIRLKTFSRERDKDGNVSLEGYIQNITDIQKSRNDINLLTHAINNSTEDIFAAKEDGTLIFANRLFKLHHELGSTDDISQLKIYEIGSYTRTLEGWQQMISSIKEGEKHQSFTVYNPLPRFPEILAYEGNAYWVTSDEGVGTIWAFGRDISQRIRHEQQIKWFNQILDKTMEHLPAGIVVKDIRNNFKYLYRNRESYNRDVPMEEALGKDDFDFYPLEIAREKRRQDKDIATTGQEMHWIAEERDGHGNPLFLDKRKMKIESKDFSPILLNIEWDITEMELMKRELMVAKEKAETSDQLKSAFLANMSHEIRTPLNSIVGFSQILSSYFSDSDDTKEYAHIIEQNSTNLLQLVNDVLDLSYLDGERDIPAQTIADITGVCQTCIDQVRFKLKPDVQLIFTPERENFTMQTNPDRISQILMNLLQNAAKFTREGSITLTYHIREEEKIILFSITDTGIGIPADKQETVFERFTKLDSFVPGTGLGLSISRMIAEKMGGTLIVDSTYTTGCRFILTLPLKE